MTTKTVTGVSLTVTVADLTFTLTQKDADESEWEVTVTSLTPWFKRRSWEVEQTAFTEEDQRDLLWDEATDYLREYVHFEQAEVEIEVEEEDLDED